MVGERVKNIEEIRPYFKICTTPDHSFMQFFNPLGKAYGSEDSSKVEKDISDWYRVFKFMNTSKFGRPVTVTAWVNVSKVRKIIKGDDRCTIRDITKAVGLSLSWMHCILKLLWKYERFLSDGFLHLITDDKLVRVQTAKQFLRLYYKLN